jgi:hypothetical protein
MKETRTNSQAVTINKKQFMNDYHLISKLERVEGTSMAVALAS